MSRQVRIEKEKITKNRFINSNQNPNFKYYFDFQFIKLIFSNIIFNSSQYSNIILTSIIILFVKTQIQYQVQIKLYNSVQTQANSIQIIIIYIKILFVRVQSYFPLKQATSKELTVNVTSKKENNFIFSKLMITTHESQKVYMFKIINVKT